MKKLNEREIIQIMNGKKNRSEDIEIFKLGNYLTPLLIGLYANSPFKDKKPTGFYSYRNKVWQKREVCGRRQG